MDPNVGREVAALQRLTVKQLRQKFAEVFGEETNGHNKVWLVKRIAWRLQARAEGGLSDRAKRRAAELADDADLRMNPPARKTLAHAEERTTVHPMISPKKDRLPPPGTILTRIYKGAVLQVQVRSDGFEYEGVMYTSLSAVAKHITGSHCNGYLFFRLTRPGSKA